MNRFFVALGFLSVYGLGDTALAAIGFVGLDGKAFLLAAKGTSAGGSESAELSIDACPEYYSLSKAKCPSCDCVDPIFNFLQAKEMTSLLRNRLEVVNSGSKDQPFLQPFRKYFDAAAVHPTEEEVKRNEDAIRTELETLDRIVQFVEDSPGKPQDLNPHFKKLRTSQITLQTLLQTKAERLRKDSLAARGDELLSQFLMLATEPRMHLVIEGQNPVDFTELALRLLSFNSAIHVASAVNGSQLTRFYVDQIGEVWIDGLSTGKLTLLPNKRSTGAVLAAHDTVDAWVFIVSPDGEVWGRTAQREWMPWGGTFKQLIYIDFAEGKLHLEAQKDDGTLWSMLAPGRWIKK